MASRRTIHVLKNNQTNNGALPISGVQMGEPLVNLYNGIIFFSGKTGGNFTQSNLDPTYFEVGSNLYNLGIRNQITSYSGITNLTGKYLAGSANGFVLADISSITGIDTYVTGFTYSPNTITLSQNQGQPNLTVTLNSFNSLNLYGTTLINGNITITGTGLYNTVATGTNPLEIVNYASLTAYTSTFDGNDTYVTGGTNTSSTNNTNVASIGLKYNKDIPDGTYTLPYTNTFVTGGTYNAGTITLTKNDSTQVAITGLLSSDTYVTGFTYNSTNNLLTISQNQGQPNLTAAIDTVSGLTVSNLTPNQVVYVGSNNELKTDSIGEFAFNESTNTLQLGTTSGNLVVNNPIGLISTFGQGGVTIGSGGSHSVVGTGDLIVHGNFIVFGTGTTISTNELFVEDPQITLNYNPTGNTYLTSIASGIKIQNGAGLNISGNTTSGDTYLTIAQLNTLTGINGNTPSVAEYTGSVGFENRGWLTQLNDIVIRNTNLNNGAPNGVRVLAEFDILDGGQY